MKLVVIIMISTLMQVSAASFGQKLSYAKKGASLEEVFKQITLQTGYNVLYAPEKINELKKIDVNFKNTALKDVLDELTKNDAIVYAIDEKNIIIKSKEPSFLETVISTVRRNLADTDVRGRVVDEQGNPMPNASIQIKGTSKATTSNDKGEFVIKDVAEDAVLVIRYVGYKALEIPVKGASMPLEIKLNQLTGQLEEVAVKGNTGYQVIDKNHPGSFDVIDKSLLNRSVSSRILDRIENLSTGVSFNKSADGLLIRGRASIFSDVYPLIILDNFPYDGKIENINPNDIESVTILKDAAAAAIWGARAGNGVIVLTTKRGKTEKPSIEFNSNVSLQRKPDLKTLPWLSSSDFIDVEKFLFSKNYYANDETLNQLGMGNPAFTPVIEILIAQRDGLISEQEANAKIEALKMNDVRNDLGKYFYRSNTDIRSAINVSGNTSNLNYYLSAGYDKNLPVLVGNTSNRISLISRNTFKVSPRLEIEGNIHFAQNNVNEGGNRGYAINKLYPYADLVDDSGNALELNNTYRKAYTDTITNNSNLLNWKYYPLEEINNIDYRNKSRQTNLSTAFRYRITDFLKVEARYEYQSLLSIGNRVAKKESYEVRDLVNRFYQPGATIEFPVPQAGILGLFNDEATSHNGRFQLILNKKFGAKHSLNGLVGFEMKDLTTKRNATTIYGYNRAGNSVISDIDFRTQYPQFQYGQYSSSFTSSIFNPQSISELKDRFISYYANMLYSYDDRIGVSLSAREDAANLFGVSTNQKGIPLWSVGSTWTISNEKFYNVDWLSNVKIRASYGFTGNYSKSASAYMTARFTPNSNANLLLPTAQILTPPNAELRWEEVKLVNFGVEFGLLKGRISTNAQFYIKDGDYLMAPAPIDPTLGMPSGSIFFKNVASTKGKGWEVQINSSNISGKFNWGSTFSFSTASPKVSRYLIPPSNLADTYFYSGSINPVAGKPVYALYSFPWGGLDPENGDPLGFKDGKLSNDYTKIKSSANIDSLKYHGPVSARVFGSFLNRFSYGNFSLSLNISYRFGYYFKANSIVYESLASTWTAHSDYGKRWQIPGDELKTNVPSFQYPLTPNRGYFYANSSILVHKGDQIRLEDIRIDYSIRPRNGSNFLFRNMNLYLYANNLGVLWTANKQGIDPNNPTGFNVNTSSISFGLTANF